MAEIKLSKREAATLAVLKRGETMLAEVDNTEEGQKAGSRRFFLSSGKKVGPGTARGLIKKGVVVPLPSTLFPEAGAQQWAAA